MHRLAAARWGAAIGVLGLAAGLTVSGLRLGDLTTPPPIDLARPPRAGSGSDFHLVEPQRVVPVGTTGGTPGTEAPAGPGADDVAGAPGAGATAAGPAGAGEAPSAPVAGVVSSIVPSTLPVAGDVTGPPATSVTVLEAPPLSLPGLTLPGGPVGLPALQPSPDGGSGTVAPVAVGR